MSLINKLMLGTAQFGMPYGVSNRSGQVSIVEASKILEYARCCGVHVLDTAVAYGNSEEVLGKAGTDGFDIVTKLPSCAGVNNISKWVNETVNNSLTLLKQPKVYAILLHRPLELLEEHGKEIYNSLIDLQNKGLIDKIGISIYEPSDLDQLYSYFKFQIVQTPYNLFDQRIVDSGWLERLFNDDIEVHIRSVFLQGLLLMKDQYRPPRFSKWSKNFNALDAYAELTGFTKLELALNFVLQNKFTSRVLVGVESKNQFQEIVKSVNNKFVICPPEIVKSEDPDLINPVNWKI